MTFRTFLLYCPAFALVLASFTPLATGQVGPSPPSPPTSPVCTAQAQVTRSLRAEGLTEMASDIVLICDAFAVAAQGAPLPSASLIVLLNAPITSRIYANGWSEVLLTVDEPNSGLQGYATTQLACADPNGICTVPGTGGHFTPFDGSAGHPNVFIGRVSGNTVTFPAVPLDGTRRIYRVTNLRVNAASVAPRLYGVQTPLVASLSFSNGLAIDHGANLTVGYVGHSIDLSLRSPDGSTAANLPGFAVSQCNTPQRIATFRALQIQFDWGMMKRSFAFYVDSETSPPPMIMNVPGVVYAVETAFYNPALSASTVDFATVGLADTGTRIRGIITNVPPGSKVFVSLTPMATSTVCMPGRSCMARLVQNETGAFLPVPASATLDGIAVAQLPVVNGNATAIWEVLEPGLLFDFGIWVQSGQAGGTANFAASLGPAPPAFDAFSGGSASATLPIPRFVDAGTVAPLFYTNACAVLAPTSTTLSVTATGVPLQYALAAKVMTPSPATSGVPTGNVTFYDNGVPIPGSSNVLSAAGTASFLSAIPTGAHHLIALFTPDNPRFFTPSASPDTTVSVTGRANSSLEVASSSNPSLPGQAVTFTALVAGGAATGSVQFTDGSRSLGTVTMSGGRASVSTTFTTAGVHEIFAIYAGDGGNSESTGRFVQTVERATGSLSLAASTDAAAAGQAVTFTATLASSVSSSVAAATGTVQFVEGQAVLGTAPLTARAASLALSTLAPGTHQILAIYTGDANWYGLHSSLITVAVRRGASTLLLTSAASLNEVKLTAVISVTTNSGSVQFLDAQSNVAIGEAQPAGGTATLSLSPTAAAKIAGHTISAVYSGSELLAPGSSNPLVMTGLRNAAGGDCPEFAAHEMATLFGIKLADSTDANSFTVMVADATGAALAGGVSNVSATQVNFLMPAGLARGPALVTLTRTGIAVAAVPITIGRVAPGLFAATQVVHGDSGAAILVLYGTGIRNRTGNATVTCMMNGTPLPVTYAGAQPDYAGLDQVNVPLPSDLRTTSTLNVSLMVDGQSSNVISVDMK